MKGILRFFFDTLIYGCITIALGIMAGHPWVGILAALLITIVIYSASIMSLLAGAEFALRKPPLPGVTWIKWNIAKDVFGIETDYRGNEIAWNGEPFLFLPMESQSDVSPKPYEMLSLVEMVQEKDRLGIIGALKRIASNRGPGRPKGSVDQELDVIDQLAMKMLSDGMDFHETFEILGPQSYYPGTWETFEIWQRTTLFETWKRRLLRKIDNLQE